eukprot:Skav206565  [mRNA]  locus=scaffold925:71200:71802:+ [translate_table: standard]
MGFDPANNLRVLPLEGARNWCPTELSVRQLFTHVLDIFGKPNRKFFETLSLFAKDEGEKKQLQSIVENSKEGAALYRDLTHDFAHHADVFKKFSSARPPIEHLLQMMPVLKPRSYSIASSPLMHPDRIQLCVVLVDWTVESTQELRLGECTGHGPGGSGQRVGIPAGTFQIFSMRLNPVASGLSCMQILQSEYETIIMLK